MYSYNQTGGLSQFYLSVYFFLRPVVAQGDRETGSKFDRLWVQFSLEEIKYVFLILSFGNKAKPSELGEKWGKEVS